MVKSLCLPFILKYFLSLSLFRILSHLAVDLKAARSTFIFLSRQFIVDLLKIFPLKIFSIFLSVLYCWYSCSLFLLLCQLASQFFVYLRLLLSLVSIFMQYIRCPGHFSRLDLMKLIVFLLQIRFFNSLLKLLMYFLFILQLLSEFFFCRTIYHSVKYDNFCHNFHLSVTSN